MTRREIKLVNTGTSPEVELKLGAKEAVILEINAGFGTYDFGGIKCALIAKRTNEDWDSYFATGVTVPAPGGDHASVFSWHGCKYWDGDRYTLKVVGKPSASDTLYVDLVIDEEIGKYVGLGNLIGGSNLAWTFPGGWPRSNFETLGAVDEHSFTVPNGKAWLWSGMILAERDVNATLVMTLKDSNDQIFLTFDSFAAGVSDVYWPQTATGTANQNLAILLGMRWPIPAGWYIHLAYGAAQATPWVGCPVVEVPT